MNTIPPVREQVARFSGGRSAKADGKPQREIFADRDVQILGSIGRSSFARTKDGRSWRLKGPVMPYAVEQAGPDAILVTKLVRAPDGRVRTDTYIGVPVEDDLFERLAKQKAYRPKEPGPVRSTA